jgi:recombinational DNA repair protein (RecF pathway)
VEPGLFERAHEALSRVDAEAPREELLLAFHMNLLGQLGHGPILDACVVTGARAPEGRPAFFDPGRGGLVARAAGGGPLLLEWPVRRALLAALDDPDPGPDPWDPETRRSARQLLASFTERQLGKVMRATALVVETVGEASQGRSGSL